MIDYLSDISDNPLPVAERKSPAFIEDKDVIKRSEDENRKFTNYLYRNLDVAEGKLDIFTMKDKIIQLAKEQEELERGERPALNNSQALYEDMKDTINQFKRYVDLVEDHAKIRKYRSSELHDSYYWVSNYVQQRGLVFLLEQGEVIPRNHKQWSKCYEEVRKHNHDGATCGQCEPFHLEQRAKCTTARVL
uniref:Uncharacterized protein n=1 Tax=Rhodnius prolixus TaxID=13249 RepID=T1HVN4_RHOPR